MRKQVMKASMSTARALCIGLLLATPSAARGAQAPLRAASSATEPHFVSVTVHSSLERSLTAKEPRYGRALAAEVARLLRWRGDILRNVRPEDELAVLFELVASPANHLLAPEIVAMRYQGARLRLDAFRFGDSDGVSRYFDATGERIDPVMMHPPVPNYAQITEVVQKGRGRRKHRGDDLMAKEGSRVVLPFAGTISRLNWHRRKNGRCIEVRLDAGYTAHFLHLARVAPELHVGQHLPAGTELGEVGNTGHSSGPHLHYELLRGREPIEPLRIHGRARQMISAAQQDAFARTKLALTQRLIDGQRHSPRPPVEGADSHNAAE